MRKNRRKGKIENGIDERKIGIEIKVDEDEEEISIKEK